MRADALKGSNEFHSRHRHWAGTSSRFRPAAPPASAPPLARCRPATRLSYSPLKTRLVRGLRSGRRVSMIGITESIAAKLRILVTTWRTASWRDFRECRQRVRRGQRVRVALGGAGEAAEEHSRGHGDRSAQFGADRIGVANPENPDYFPASCAVGIETPDERCAWERGRARG